MNPNIRSESVLGGQVKVLDGNAENTPLRMPPTGPQQHLWVRRASLCRNGSKDRGWRFAQESSRVPFFRHSALSGGGKKLPSGEHGAMLHTLLRRQERVDEWLHIQGVHHVIVVHVGVVEGTTRILIAVL